MIRAVIFDCYGVLTTDGWFPVCHRYFGDSPELWDRATTLNREVNAKLITYEMFCQELAQMAGITPVQFRHELETNVSNEQLFAYIADRLTPEYAIGVLSNMGGDWLDQLFTVEQLQLIDEVVLSHSIGAVKPQAAMYETIATRLGMIPEECVFIDDQERYCEGAKDVGMKAIWYQNFEQMKHELEEVLHA